MLEKDFLELMKIGENSEVEFKTAELQLPKSLWETYSSFANTNGGTIFLGVEETNDGLAIRDVDVVKLQSEFWDNINNPQKINANILRNSDVFSIQIDGKRILQINVPRAMRQQKPISVNSNPYLGTYKRNHEGDYRCNKEEVDSMIAESSNKALDALVVKRAFSDINIDTLRGYRQRFKVGNPDHDWNELDDVEFLKRIGAWGVDSEIGLEGLTYAGLICFGTEMTITAELPHYFLDYREKLSSIPDQRWSHRIISQDGKWSGNLLDFYYIVIKRLHEDLDVPFELSGEFLERQMETGVHKALREALINTLVHADHLRGGKIIIEKEKNRFTFRNSGLLRIPKERAIYGGLSDARNRNIFKIFALLSLGEQSGYGLENIHTVWKENGWERPVIKEDFQPEQVVVVLEQLESVQKKSSNSVPKGSNQKVPIKDSNPAPKSSKNLQKLIGDIPNKKKVPLKELQGAVLIICSEQFLTLQTIASILNKDESHVRKTILKPLINDGKIQLKYPNKLTHKNQSYKTTKAELLS